MRNVKTKVIKEITEATETISESLIRNLKNLPRKHDNERVETTAATLGTAQVLRKVVTLMYTKHSTWEITMYYNLLSFG